MISFSFLFLNMRSILYLIAVLIVSCTSHQKSDSVQYTETRQRLATDKDLTTSFGKIIPDSVSVGTELVAKIFSIQPALQIEKVFMQCDSCIEASIDTVTLEINSCINELIIKDDTVLIAFKPTVPGKHQFPEFNILTRDDHRVFHLQRYSFEYFAIESID